LEPSVRVKTGPASISWAKKMADEPPFFEERGMTSEPSRQRCRTSKTENVQRRDVIGGSKNLFEKRGRLCEL